MNQQPENQDQPVQQQMPLDAYCDIVLWNVIRGTTLSLPNHAPQVILMAMCRSLARFIGLSFQGDLATILTIRKMCRDGFNDSLQKSPPPPMGPVSQSATPLQTVNGGRA